MHPCRGLPSKPYCFLNIHNLIFQHRLSFDQLLFVNGIILHFRFGTVLLMNKVFMDIIEHAVFLIILVALGCYPIPFSHLFCKSIVVRFFQIGNGMHVDRWLRMRRSLSFMLLIMLWFGFAALIFRLLPNIIFRFIYFIVDSARIIVFRGIFKFGFDAVIIPLQLILMHSGCSLFPLYFQQLFVLQNHLFKVISLLGILFGVRQNFLIQYLLHFRFDFFQLVVAVFWNRISVFKLGDSPLGVLIENLLIVGVKEG